MRHTWRDVSDFTAWRLTPKAPTRSCAPAPLSAALVHGPRARHCSPRPPGPAGLGSASVSGSLTALEPPGSGIGCTWPSVRPASLGAGLRVGPRWGVRQTRSPTGCRPCFACPFASWWTRAVCSRPWAVTLLGARGVKLPCGPCPCPSGCEPVSGPGSRGDSLSRGLSGEPCAVSHVVHGGPVSLHPLFAALLGGMKRSPAVGFVCLSLVTAVQTAVCVLAVVCLLWRDGHQILCPFFNQVVCS